MARFHLGQYETRGYRGVAGAPSGGDVDLDRTNLGVDHVTIDDNLRVLAHLQLLLRLNIVP